VTTTAPNTNNNQIQSMNKKVSSSTTNTFTNTNTFLNDQRPWKLELLDRYSERIQSNIMHRREALQSTNTYLHTSHEQFLTTISKETQQYQHLSQQNEEIMIRLNQVYHRYNDTQHSNQQQQQQQSPFTTILSSSVAGNNEQQRNMSMMMIMPVQPSYQTMHL
jgi:hypothetical protein